MFIGGRAEVRFSTVLRSRLSARKTDPTLEWMLSFEGRPLTIPRRFRPDPDFLMQHRVKSLA
jgi:hypothetical protein